ncbi:MAG TPA: CRISPR-associated endonuclease Cas1, partial [Urbifossiella sp.]|nr:CRISPR-associated endonuclease Cas1 [Urbifossiella sp.]
MRRTTSVAAGVAHLVGPGNLKVVNGHLAFSPQGDRSLRLDPAALTAVTCYGDVSVTAAALEVLFRHNVPAAWLTPAGTRCRGRLARTDAATTLTRVRQHRAFARAEARLAWAKRMVVGKVEAMTAAGRHFQRHGAATAGPLMTRLADYAGRVPGVAGLEQLLGLEGAASAAWFEFFATLLVPPWSFPGRVRRPPTDPTNALLSLGYTWLLTRATARAEARGFEIYLGGLHEYRAGRPSLACDLIEPLRVPAVDRWAVAVCNQGDLRPDHFREEEGGGFRLQPRYFGRTLHSWETYWAAAEMDRELDGWLDRLAAVIRTSDQ